MSYDWVYKCVVLAATTAMTDICFEICVTSALPLSQLSYNNGFRTISLWIICPRTKYPPV